MRRGLTEYGALRNQTEILHEINSAMLPRRIPFNQIAFVTLVGVGGGIYIYKPMFEPRRKTSSGQKEGAASAEAGSKEQEAGLTTVLVPGAKREEAAAAEQ